MLLSEDIVEETEEMRYYGTKAPRSWFIVDERKVDRFAHVGDTIVPGAGVRWKHVHRKSGSTLGPAAEAAAAVQPSWFGGGATTQLATVDEDNTDERAWRSVGTTSPAPHHHPALCTPAASSRLFCAPTLSPLSPPSLPSSPLRPRSAMAGDCHS
jgi:hypothetical protein